MRSPELTGAALLIGALLTGCGTEDSPTAWGSSYLIGSMSL
jgi:hypothetical protein